MGHRLKELRESRGLTQEKLARLADLSVRTISGIETGTHLPRRRTWRLIIEALEHTGKATAFPETPNPPNGGSGAVGGPAKRTAR